MGLKAESIIPFIVGALVAGVIGAAIVVSRVSCYRGIAMSMIVSIITLS